MNTTLKGRRAVSRGTVSDELFGSLVLNAFDFLEGSLRELEKSPKYSVIHFFNAIELFLKARLLREHWALVVSKTEKANLEAFRKGDFQSVRFDECVNRIRSIANEPIAAYEEESFKQLRDHRNKLVHFFHPKYVAGVDAKLLGEVVSEQCKAWFYLHRLLTTRWEPRFAAYATKIARLDKLFCRNRHFLSSKFKALEPEIQAAKKTGIAIEKCAACGFEAARATEISAPLFKRACLVCNCAGHILEIKCPTCGAMITVEPEDGGECAQCEFVVGVDYLLSTLGPYEDPKEDRLVAYCSSCEQHEPTAIPFGDDYLCLQCLELHTSAGQCGWCGDLITGDTSGTSVWGCFRCPGPDLDRD